MLRDGRVLAARRTAPPAAAGRWELPGGKVEPGEAPADAVARELVEELGVDVEVTGWLPGRVPVGDALELAVATAVLVRGEPEAREHDRLCWVDAAGLADLDWLDGDRPFLPALAALLAPDDGAPTPPTGTRRVVLFEEDDARAVARRLLDDGFATSVERERLAGEDDDEDHPWAVLTDAPPAVVEVLVDRHDGWWEEDDPSPAAVPVLPPSPAPLPSGPRRVKRPDGGPGGGPRGGVGGRH
ncbi:CTP pyrophosphohydrolase [Nocardioides sp. AX2bis]|nr:CTP pyrophosphohydrolase [Nocardioides sp. AX2bis]